MNGWENQLGGLGGEAQRLAQQHGHVIRRSIRRGQIALAVAVEIGYGQYHRAARDGEVLFGGEGTVAFDFGEGLFDL